MSKLASLFSGVTVLLLIACAVYFFTLDDESELELDLRANGAAERVLPQNVPSGFTMSGFEKPNPAGVQAWRFNFSDGTKNPVVCVSQRAKPAIMACSGANRSKKFTREGRTYFVAVSAGVRPKEWWNGYGAEVTPIEDLTYLPSA